MRRNFSCDELDEEYAIFDETTSILAPASKGGTGGMLEADEIVFDQSGRVNKSSNDEVIDASDQQLGEEEMRAMWLRKVETRPADFLAARFNYQLAVRDKPTAESEDD